MAASLGSRLLAEAIGTFILVLAGCFIAAQVGKVSGYNYLSIAIAFGLALTFIVYIFGQYSAHANPAVSFAFTLDGKLPPSEMLLYWIAQLIGALLAAGLLAYLIGASSGLGESIGEFTKTAPFKAIIVEAFITMLLVLTILFVGGDNKYSMIAGLVIGLSLLTAVLVGAYYTGGSANPARSFGPFVFTKNLQYMYIYILGPFLGALIAFLIYRMFGPTKKFVITTE